MGIVSSSLEADRVQGFLCLHEVVCTYCIFKLHREEFESRHFHGKGIRVSNRYTISAPQFYITVHFYIDIMLKERWRWKHPLVNNGRAGLILLSA